MTYKMEKDINRIYKGDLKDISEYSKYIDRICSMVLMWSKKLDKVN